MPLLNWNEIRSRAIAFSREWSDERRESAEAQTFWNEFFHVFGLRRRHVASFEEPVRGIKGTYGFIDLLWRGRLIAEHKSRGASLDRAELQACTYLQDLASSGRSDEVPRHVIVSDFAHLALHDLESTEPALRFPLQDLHLHVRAFSFIPGYEARASDPEDPANFKATQLLADLHDALLDGGYPTEKLERFLVRILFCLFAEDTALFEPDAFRLFLQNHTREDGSDLGARLAQFFDVLNRPPDRRSANLDEDLAGLPYVNGDLFADHLDFADFSAGMRLLLIRCSEFRWATISPAIFGSLFQEVMKPRDRRQIGAHYTTERDILRLIEPLFLSNLRAELRRAARAGKPALRRFRDRLGTLRFLDPACGCGNFLVVAYRELRQLELETLQLLHSGRHVTRRLDFDLRSELRVSVDQMCGIEIGEWPCRIAEVAMWLMDHQMNLKVSGAFGQLIARLPLESSARILHANALRVDWAKLLPPQECSYVLGNPPFAGKKEQSSEQKRDVLTAWQGARGVGILDYVTCWYAAARRYIGEHPISCAFVSTNSITQGEQVAVLWRALRQLGSVSIDFAHRTFAWTSEARGRAHVHVVIIGFSSQQRRDRTLYVYDTPTGDPHEVPVENISPYLTEGPDVAVESRTTPLCAAPAMSYGSMMIDKPRGAGEDEGLVFGGAVRDTIVAESPALSAYIRPLCGGDEFLSGTKRWCLWLADAPPALVRSSPEAERRVAKVRAFRLGSRRAQTRALASTPQLFGELRQPSTRYLLVPKVSSERRDYIPIGFVDPDVVASGSALVVPGSTLWHFGVLSSAMHNAWLRTVAGRMKSDPQYSARLVYNNFPWPVDATPKQRVAVESAAQRVLDARAEHAPASLSDLYDPLLMPQSLAHAHRKLDRAVDRCYRRQPFTGERFRFEHLLTMYVRLCLPLAATPRQPRRRRRDPNPD